MQRPRAGTSHEECIAKLHFACLRVGEVSEGTIERLDPRRRAGIDHLCQRVVPEVLLVDRASFATLSVSEHLVLWMASAHARRLHGARGGKIGRTQAHPMHA